MLTKLLNLFDNYVPGFHRLRQVPRQMMGISPFAGDTKPTRMPLFRRGGRPSLPFPHPWNYDQPIPILDTYFWGANAETGAGRHNRYLEVPAPPENRWNCRDDSATRHDRRQRGLSGAGNEFAAGAVPFPPSQPQQRCRVEDGREFGAGSTSGVANEIPPDRIGVLSHDLPLDFRPLVPPKI